MGSIFRAWLPLALSFLFMMFEGPALQAGMGRLPDIERNLGAWGLSMLLSLLVESPVIMLLATSIALVRGPASYLAMRAFTLRLCGWLTLVTALLAFTPMFDVVCGLLLHQPSGIVHAARPALGIMLLWTAAIGWRRFCQGILVAHHRTSLVSWGTLVRLSMVVTFAILLVMSQRLDGVRVAALSIMAGVMAEAVASTIFAQPLVAKLMSESDKAETPLTQADIFWFHLPLAATTLLTLLAGPLTSAALGRLPSAEESLAAWPVAFSVVMVIRSGPFALQEITVARARMHAEEEALRRFTLLVGCVTSAFTVLIGATPLLDYYAEAFLHLPAHLLPLVRQAVLLSAFMPFLTSVTSWGRGLLVAVGRTVAVYQAMGLGLLTAAFLLVAGVYLRAPAMELAPLASTIGTTVELAWLSVQRRLNRRR